MLYYTQPLVGHKGSIQKVTLLKKQMVCCFPQEPLTRGLHLRSTSLTSVKNFKNTGTNNVPLLSDEFSLFLPRHK